MDEEEETMEYVLEWLNLLKYPKTKRVAVRCLIYMADVVEKDPKKRKRFFDGVFGTSDDAVLTKVRLNAIQSDEDKEINEARELLKAAKDCLFDKPKKRRRSISFQEFINTTERGILNIFKPMKDSAYKKFKVPDDTKKSIAIFEKLIVDRNKSRKLTHQKADEILYASIIFLAKFHNNFPTTPLHIAIRNDDLDALIMLLSHGESADGKCYEEEDTPLILALRTDKSLFVKALILFGADVKEQWEEIKEMSLSVDCQKIIRECRPIPKKLQKELPREWKRHMQNVVYNEENKLSTQPKTHLLSLDGGGIRGLVMTTIIAELEKEFGENFIQENFSFLAGSSTGAILAIALSQGKSVSECRNIYFKLKDIVFYRNTMAEPYSHKLLEDFLKKELNGSEKMSTLKTRNGKFVIITSSNVSGSKMNTDLYKSYKIKPKHDIPMEMFNDNLEHESQTNFEDADSDGKVSKCGSERSLETAIDYLEGEESNDQLRRDMVFDEVRDTKKDNLCPYETEIWLAARSSSAATTFFISPDDTHEDGGIIANNPSGILLSEFQNVGNSFKSNDGKRLKLGICLSLGTGQAKEKPPSNWKIIEWLRGAKFTTSILRFVRLFSGQIGRSDGSIITCSKAHAEAMNGVFLRFSPEFEKEIGLDETSNETLIKMMWDTKVYMRNQLSIKRRKYIEALLKQTMEKWEPVPEPEPSDRIEKNEVVY